MSQGNHSQGNHSQGNHEAPHDEHEPIVRDKRRIDPVTGELRTPAETQSQSAAAPQGAAAPAGAGQGSASGEEDALRAQLAERTADLQRLQADFANYRKRVERDRQATSELALANVLANLLPVLDDIGRARDHGELEGGFKSVAETLEASVTKLGLSAYGVAGEPFDPMVHEALTHTWSAEVTEPTCVAILQPGYRLGERVLRPARVAVAEPEPASEASEGSQASESGDAAPSDE